MLATFTPPPFTITTPSGSIAVPGQNMSCLLLVTTRPDADIVAGLKSAVYVR